MTTIAAKTMVQGRISGQGDLTVHGRVRGSIVLGGVLSLESDGIIEARVSVVRALISGVFVGDLYATERIDVLESARIVGNLYSPLLRVTAGAQLRGRADTVNPIPGEHAVSSVAKTAKPTKAPIKAEAPTKAETPVKAAPRIEAEPPKTIETPKSVEPPKTEVLRPVRFEAPKPSPRPEAKTEAPKIIEAPHEDPKAPDDSSAYRCIESRQAVVLLA